MTPLLTRRSFLQQSLGALAALGLQRAMGPALTASASEGSKPATCPTIRATTAAVPAPTPHLLAPLSWSRIKIVGVGGAGGRAIERMLQRPIAGAEFIIADTNLNRGQYPPGQRSILLGPTLARGLGAGGLLARGAAAAELSAAELQEVLAGADMVLLVAGLGGGTGGGAAPVIARLAREAGAAAVGLVTLPFCFEGRRRAARAQEGLIALREDCDAVIAIPCEGLIPTHHDKSLMAAFGALDDLLCRAAQDLVEPVTVPGLINVDLADLRAVLFQGGLGRIGTGQAAGEGAGRLAAEAALASPFLAGPIDRAQSMFCSIRGGAGLILHEVALTGECLAQAADPLANVFWGVTIDPELADDEVKVMLIAMGL